MPAEEAAIRLVPPILAPKIDPLWINVTASGAAKPTTGRETTPDRRPVLEAELQKERRTNWITASQAGIRDLR